jgi:rhodanese-related sulfurtransferase
MGWAAQEGEGRVARVGILGGYRSVNVREAKELVERGYQLVDVRSSREWAGGHAEGARNIPLPDLESSLDELPKDVPVVAMCHTGIRSALAARKLTKLGYTVANLRGGMIAWERAHSKP